MSFNVEIKKSYYEPASELAAEGSDELIKNLLIAGNDIDLYGDGSEVYNFDNVLDNVAVVNRKILSSLLRELARGKTPDWANPHINNALDKVVEEIQTSLRCALDDK